MPGFMRQRTQERIEQLAAENTRTTIDLELVEDGIEVGHKMMGELLASYEKTEATTGKNGGNGTVKSGTDDDLYLNEVGFMSRLGARRRPN